VTGEDLKEMGYSPGPVFSSILRAVEDAQLEGQVKTPEEAKEYVRRVWAHDAGTSAGH